MTGITPPPEHDPSPQRRQAIRSALHGTDPGRRRTPVLAAAAVAAVVAAGIVIPQLRADDPGDSGGPAGGPDPAVATPKPSLTAQTGAAKPRIPEQTKNPPKDPVEICRDTVAENGTNSGAPVPGRDAKVAVRLDGRWGVTLILSDGRLWVGCDTAHYTHGGKGSILEPSKLLAPAANDGGAFAVSNLALADPGKPPSAKAPIYDHYWAAGLLPRGVAGIRYTFPDGASKNATVNGRFWIVEHLESEPVRQAQKDRIRVALIRADGSVVRTHRLTWGEQTCAHVNHGC